MINERPATPCPLRPSHPRRPFSPPSLPPPSLEYDPNLIFASRFASEKPLPPNVDTPDPPSAFEDRGMDSLAQQWADRMPSLNAVAPAFDSNTPAFDSSSSPAAAFTRQGESGGVRARRVAQDRGRYTGFDDGRFKALRQPTASTRPGDRFTRMPGGAGGGYGQGGGGYAGGGAVRGGKSPQGGANRGSPGEAEERGWVSSQSGGGWAERYSR